MNDFIVTMPPRLNSTVSAVSVLDWSDREAYRTSKSTKIKLVSQSITQQPLTKSVHFVQENAIYLIPHLDDFSNEELSSLWYDSGDYMEMKNQYKETIFLMECGKMMDEVEHTARGLEYRTQEGVWTRYENKRDAYNAVLDEQDLQWKLDSDDFEQIRKVYLEYSTKCTVAAVKIAEQDADEAKNIHKERASQKEVCTLPLVRSLKRSTKTSSFRRLFGGNKHKEEVTHARILPS